MKKDSTFFLLLFAAAVCGQPVEITDFSGVNVVDDATVSLSAYRDKPGLVVIFRGNECAFDEYYTQRISELIKQYDGKVPFLLVNPYSEPAEAVDKMKMHATVWRLNIPYLADKDQVIMGMLGAKKTPEAFVLKNADGKFSTIYGGAIDDNPQLPAAVRQKYLQSAIDALINGQSQPLPRVRTTGCTIRSR